jgi:hypothetical protein
VREREEDEVDVGHLSRVERPEDTLTPAEMGMNGTQSLSRRAVGAEIDGIERRVGVDEPDELASGVPG